MKLVLILILFICVGAQAQSVKDIRTFTYTSATVNDTIPYIRGLDRITTVGSIVDLADVDSITSSGTYLYLWNNGSADSVNVQLTSIFTDSTGVEIIKNRTANRSYQFDGRGVNLLLGNMIDTDSPLGYDSTLVIYGDGWYAGFNAENSSGGKVHELAFSKNGTDQVGFSIRESDSTFVFQNSSDYVFLDMMSVSDTVDISFPNADGTLDIQDYYGWATYNDTLVTQSSPIVISQGDTATIGNGAHTSITSQLPTGANGLYQSSDSTIRFVSAGDAGELRLDFEAQSSVNNGYCTVLLDIGPNDNNPIVIVQRTVTFPRGSNIWHTFSLGIPVYCLNTCIANGIRVRVIAGSGNISVASPIFFIKKDYNAK